MFQERRKALEQVLGRPLPTKRQEASNPDHADDAYIAAVRALIGRVRERKEEFPRLHEENIHYGFARNLLALKPIALPLLLLGLGGGVWVMRRTGLSAPGVILAAVYAVAIGVWALFVRPNWVRQVGTTYAERLFETLDTLSQSSIVATSILEQRSALDDSQPVVE